MINHYSIHNYKNHRQTALELKPLTILTGKNGMGKSSVLQTMLMLRESYIGNRLPDMLSLVGKSFYVGKSSALVFRGCKERPDCLDLTVITDSSRKSVFSFKYPEAEASFLEKDETNSAIDDEMFKEESLFSRNDFQYLSAFRMGPALESYNANVLAGGDSKQLSVDMGRGEYAIAYLSEHQFEDIGIKQLAHERCKELQLLKQVEYWLQEVSEGISIKIDKYGDKYELSYANNGTDRRKVWVKAINTGFGISYVLSVIVALLVSKSGATVFIENPEAHIHPSGQAALMKLVSLAAQNGVQVILETHSDHIVNGALVQAKRGIIDRDNIRMYFFTRDTDGSSIPMPMTIGEDCRIKGAPSGFCDQISIDWNVLFDMEDYE